MKTLTVIIVFAVFIIGISGYLIKIRPSPEVNSTESPSERWVHKQKLMLPLFENVCEVSVDPTIRRLALEFTLDATDYSKPEVATNLRSLDSAGFLSKGEIFSEFNSNHMNELKIIYEVLYYAKNFDAFYKTAAWARQTVNCGLYVNALYFSIMNRKDTERLIIPAPFELLPNYFVKMDVLLKATSILSGEEVTPSESIHDEGNFYIIDTNYTANFYDNDEDSKLAYFREDVGLNAFYLFRKLDNAPWLNNNINNSYGERMYQTMKQLNARYNLERYANGMPEEDNLDWNTLPDTPYDPMLIYSDGSEFAHRTSHMTLTDNADALLLQTIEDNIASVVSHMRQSGYNKTQILNHLMEILVTADRSYETLARQLLGKDLTNNGHVSVLEHYMTSLRDPMFWKINKKIVTMVDSALKLLPAYSQSELFFPGVEIVNIDVKKAMTVYDYFVFDVSDALKIDGTNSTFKVKIGQPRLNHKPFTITLNISSLVASKGLVKIYFGPKLTPSELAEKKYLFTLYDMFEVNLKMGTNIITKIDENIKYMSPDFMPLSTIRKKVEYAEFGLDSFPLKTIEGQIGYPSRLSLPKGTVKGLPLQIFVFVAPYYKANLGQTYSTNSMEFNNAILSPAYPLDLDIQDSRLLFGLPNAMMKYITVTHKGDNKVENYGGPGVTKKWYSANTYDPLSRPSYSGGNAQSFDYSSKKGQSGKREDLAADVTDYNVENHDVSFSDADKDVDYTLYAPRLLSFSPFDYSSKPKEKEQFDYKAKKAQFDKKEYSKKGDYTKYRIVATAEETPAINKIESVDDEYYDSSSHSTYSKNEYNSQNEKYKKIKALVADDTDNNVNIQDVSSSEGHKGLDYVLYAPRLMSPSQFDYSAKAKRKEPFDYKAKKAQFNKEDYASKIGNYSKYRIVTTTEESPSTDTIVPVHELPIQTPAKDQYLDETSLQKGTVDYGKSNDNMDIVYVAPTQPTTRKVPSLFDFIFHGLDYDDIKLYE